MNNLTFNYLPLYLKYRPQKLSELVGQSFISQTLTNAINNNRLISGDGTLNIGVSS